MYLGYIKSSIRNKKLFTLLSIVQITITMVLVIDVLINLSTINYKEREFKNNLNVDLNNTYKFSVYGNGSGKVDLKKKLSNYFDIGSYKYYNSNIKEFKNNEKFIEKFNLDKELNNNDVPILKINKNLFNILDINITDGRSLNEDDFNLNKDNIPIIFSEEYKDIVNIGDIVTYEGIFTQRYKVVGFFNENIKWFPSNDIQFFALENLGKMGITMPSKKENESQLYEMSINSSTYITSDKLNKSEIQNIIDDANKEYGLNVEILSIKDILNRFKKENYPFILQTVFFSIFMLVSSCLGLASNMSFTIINRKKEFGIRLANGFRKKDIKLLVISEMLLLSLISTIIAMIFKFTEFYKNRQFSIAEKIIVPQFSIIDFISAIVLVVIIIVISSIIPLRNIDKLQPKEMIGGIE
ncbi:ABC transporter permease [Clostridium septicum]|uniref:ABC transporter permease n=1 Tax=Clostridium septicum TaxID=1504 RepID=UPI00321766DE